MHSNTLVPEHIHTCMQIMIITKLSAQNIVNHDIHVALN